MRLRAHPVGDTASKTKRRGQKLPALQAESNFWAPQEGKAGSSPVPEPKRKTRFSSCLSFCVCVRKDTTSFASLLATSFIQRITSLSAWQTQNEVALCANSVVLRTNDVGLRPTMLHFVQMYGIINITSEVIAMKEDKLSDLSMQLSIDVLKLTKELRAKHETVISNQISRSATSVCANIAESKYGHSRADFIAKLEIALKEASETGKWLEML